MRYRAAAVLAALAMLPLSALPVRADDSWDGVDWTLEDGVLTLTASGALPDGDDVPWQDAGTFTRLVIKGDVTAVGRGLCKGQTALTSVSLPETVTVLAPEAFSGCTSLTDIEGLDSVETFGYDCLHDTALAEATPFIIRDGVLWYAPGTETDVPAGVTEIRPFAFGDLTSERALLSSATCAVTLPDGLTAIDDYAFAYCASLTSVTLPASLETVGDYAFFDCASLEDISLPAGVRSVGAYAFWNCPALETLTVWGHGTTLGTKAYGEITDWEAVLARRQADGELTAAEAATLRAMASRVPHYFDRLSAWTAVHLPETPSWSVLMENDLVRPGTDALCCPSGRILGITGAQSAAFAEAENVPFTPIEGLLGDTNGSGAVDIMDVICLNKALLGGLTLTDLQTYVSDIDQNDRLDSTDPLLLLRMVVRLPVA